MQAIQSNVIEFPGRGSRTDDPARKLETRDAVSEERLRIARELHDVVGYSFATISMQAGAALHVIGEHPDKAIEALSAIKSASKEAVSELRGILGMLRQAEVGAAATTPGLGRLDRLAESTSAAGVRTHLHVIGRRRPLPATVDLAAFRIVQESLANILRHASAATALVTITYTRDSLIVEVEDDGRGDAGAEASPGSGHGIAGMRERALAVGGELEAGPRPDRGFHVRARLPVLGRS